MKCTSLLVQSVQYTRADPEGGFYRTKLIDSRICNFRSDCRVGKILIVAKNGDKCVGGVKWKPVNATLVLVGLLGECF